VAFVSERKIGFVLVVEPRLGSVLSLFFCQDAGFGYKVLATVITVAPGYNKPSYSESLLTLIQV